MQESLRKKTVALLNTLRMYLFWLRLIFLCMVMPSKKNEAVKTA